MLLQMLLPGLCIFTQCTQHNALMQQHEQTMKINKTVTILYLMLGPAVATSADLHKLREPLDASAVAAPAVIDEGERLNPQPLREVLRQPVDRVDGALKPYQLSPEERQRMREQLRSQSVQSNPKK
jgi:hypothetical protein